MRLSCLVHLLLWVDLGWGLGLSVTRVDGTWGWAGWYGGLHHTRSPPRRPAQPTDQEKQRTRHGETKNNTQKAHRNFLELMSPWSRMILRTCCSSSRVGGVWMDMSSQTRAVVDQSHRSPHPHKQTARRYLGRAVCALLVGRYMVHTNPTQANTLLPATSSSLPDPFSTHINIYIDTNKRTHVRTSGGMSSL